MGAMVGVADGWDVGFRDGRPVCLGLRDGRLVCLQLRDWRPVSGFDIMLQCNVESHAACCMGVACIVRACCGVMHIACMLHA